MPTTVNDAYFDAMVRAQVLLLNAGLHISDTAVGILNETEEELAEQIRGKIRKNDRNAEKAAALIIALAAIRSKAWDRIEAKWLVQFEELVRSEPELMIAALESVSPVELLLTKPELDKLRNLVKNHLAHGRTMADWIRSAKASDEQRIADAINIGVVLGESGDEVARRVVGTVRTKGADGETQGTRNQVDAIAVTLAVALADGSRELFYGLNEDIFDEELWVSVLDSRTTPICRSLDGKRFKIGEGPRPPLHVNCRSRRIPTLDGDALGQRPYRTSTAKLLLQEFTSRKHLSPVKRRIDLPRGTKGEFDAFARRRIRELTGTVPAKTTYEAWLRRQSAGFQDHVLGRTRGRLFRQGRLSLTSFVNRRGQQITLHELSRIQRQAFLDAGLNPNDF